ncbi:MAG: AAA family ATPase [Phycisphaerae bacterium]|nr:AAA family ATPase [Phycisphaerae bacterium]
MRDTRLQGSGRRTARPGGRREPRIVGNRTGQPVPKEPCVNTSKPAADLSQEELEAIDTLGRSRNRIRDELSKVIVGQSRVIDDLLICLFCRGHCILEGVPGLAKTLLVSTLSRVLSLSFNRVQFTPDLMPSDITGTEVIEENKATGVRQLRFVPGPVFANVVLADEINRTPPKTQAALLEAMQEHQVTAAGFTHKLPQPFFVLATQNPIEQEGTYPLPEAQLDRFMFKVLVDYPEEEEELEIVRLTTAVQEVRLDRIYDARQIETLQSLVRKVPCAEPVMRYAMRLTRATRREKGEPPTFVRDYVAWGAGPRATQYLVMAAKSRAILEERYHATIDDIRAVAPQVLRHRIVLNFNAEADGIRAEQIVEWLIRDVPADVTPGLDAVGARRVMA